MMNNDMLKPAEAPAWVQKTLEKIEAASRFKENWDSYGGKPLRSDVRAAAVRLLNHLQTENLPVPAVVLGSGGTVQFEWQVDGRELEVEVLPDGRLDCLKVWPDEQMEEREIGSGDLVELRELTQWLIQS
jgi:hypothetical protein